MGRYDVLLEKEQPTQPQTPAPQQPKTDNGVPIRLASQPDQTIPVRPNARTGEQSNGRTGERPNGRRIITRNSFELYEDQMEALRNRSFEEKRQGKIGSMSAMVREAIDQYLERTSK